MGIALFGVHPPRIIHRHPAIDGSRQFVYKKDFNIGDVVQVVNEYGQEATSRVTEIVISQDENGESLNYWPSTVKAQYMGRMYYGPRDVNNLFKQLGIPA